MNKKNIIFELLLTILIVFITLVSIIKFTIFNKNYIINLLDKNNYYDLLYNDTKNTIKSYIMSSGLSVSVVEDIFSKYNIKTDVNNYINYLYCNKKFVSSANNVKVLLNKNITNYLIEHNLSIENKNELEDLINNIIDIYDNEVSFYKKINNYVNLFKKINRIINVILYVLFIIIIVLFIINKSIIINEFSSILMSSSIILFFIKFILYDKISYGNILIITDGFSNILNSCLINISELMLYIGCIYVIIGVISIFIEIKRSKKNGRN